MDHPVFFDGWGRGRVRYFDLVYLFSNVGGSVVGCLAGWPSDYTANTSSANKSFFTANLWKRLINFVANLKINFKPKNKYVRLTPHFGPMCSGNA